MALDVTKALGHLPQGLRDELVEEYTKISRNYSEMRWEAAELGGGRFCEIAYSILAGHLDNDNYPARAMKPKRFREACNHLESVDAVRYSDSARLMIPRVLIAVYDVRNRRGVGHVGGDVNANHIDATFVVHCVQWIMAELVRIFHDTDIATATAIADSLVERTLPILWKVGDVTRVLDTSLSLSDQTLVLLYGSPTGLTEVSLARSLEQSRLSNYRRVLRRLHDRRIVEFAKNTLIVLSPKGARDVEKRLLPHVA